MPNIAARHEKRVRDLSGLAAEDAIGRLRVLELRPAIEPHDTTDPDAAGRVVAQDPPAGEAVRRGQLVTLLIGCAAHRPAPPDPRAHGDGAQREHTPTLAPAQALPPAPDPLAADKLPVREPVSAPAAGTSDDVVGLNDADDCTGSEDQPDEWDVPVAGTTSGTSRRRPPLRRVGLAVGALIPALALAAILVPRPSTGPARAPRPSVAARGALASAQPASPPVDRPMRRATLVRPPRITSARTRRVPRRAPGDVATTGRASAPPAAGAAPASEASSGPPATVAPWAPRRAVGAAAPSPTGPLPGPYPIQTTRGGSQ